MKIQVPVLGGLRKKVSIQGGTNIAGYGSLTLAQLATLLGVVQPGPTPPNTIGGGGNAFLTVGPGLTGGGALIGNVALGLSLGTLPSGGDIYSDQGEDYGMMLSLPGPVGQRGPQGFSIPGMDGEDGMDGFPIPGSVGPAGPTGPTGPAGPALWFEADAAEDPIHMQGPQGNLGLTGAQGVAGPAGPALWFEADAAEDPIQMQGPQGNIGPTGPAGAAGSGSGISGYQQEQDDEDWSYLAGPKLDFNYAYNFTPNDGALGIGATSLMAFGRANPGIQIAQQGTIQAASGGEFQIIGNGYYNGANYVALGTGGGNLMTFGAGAVSFWDAPSVAAGSSYTFVENFAVGTLTSPVVRAYGPVAAGLVDMTPDSGQFTGTLTGFSGTAPSGTCTWSRNGNQVMLVIPIMTGTSNATSMTMTGVPAAIQNPNRTQGFAVGDIENATVLTGTFMGSLAAGSGTVTFYFNGSQTGFTASGTKGFAVNQVVHWLLN